MAWYWDPAMSMARRPGYQKKSLQAENGSNTQNTNLRRQLLSSISSTQLLSPTCNAQKLSPLCAHCPCERLSSALSENILICILKFQSMQQENSGQARRFTKVRSTKCMTSVSQMDSRSCGLTYGHLGINQQDGYSGHIPPMLTSLWSRPTWSLSHTGKS